MAREKKAKEHKFLNKHTVLGVFLGAVYIRTGNIWPIILGHSLHDIMAFSASEKLSMLGSNLPDWSVTLLTIRNCPDD